MLVVCERWVGDGDRLLNINPSSSVIAALLSHLGLACLTVGHWGPKALCLPLVFNSASCPPADSNWLEPPQAPGYIIVSRTPASAVLPLIYTGASFDWQLGRGSICYMTFLRHKWIHHNRFHLNRFNCEQCFLLPTSETKITFFIQRVSYYGSQILGPLVW